jgi:hypothetical protein
MFLLAVPLVWIVSKKFSPCDRGKPVAAENSKRYEMTSVRFADK